MSENMESYFLNRQKYSHTMSMLSKILILFMGVIFIMFVVDNVEIKKADHDKNDSSSEIEADGLGKYYDKTLNLQFTTCYNKYGEREYSVSIYNKSLSSKIVIPETYNGISVTSIDYSGFSDSSITSVKICDNIKNIGSLAFSNCTNLKSVDLGKNIEQIPYKAFVNCFELESINLLANVKYVQVDAFSNCKGLKNIYVDVYNTEYSSIDGILYNKTKTILIKYPAGNINKSFVVSNDVKYIGNCAFADCGNLLRVELGDNILELGQQAFGNSNIHEIVIGNNITNIGYACFPTAIQKIFYKGNEEQWKALESSKIYSKNSNGITIKPEFEYNYTQESEN